MSRRAVGRLGHRTIQGFYFRMVPSIASHAGKVHRGQRNDLDTCDESSYPGEGDWVVTEFFCDPVSENATMLASTRI